MGKRYRCEKCNKIILHPLPSASERNRTTQRFVNYAVNESLEKTFAQVARDTGVTKVTIKNIFDEQVKEWDKFYQPLTPEILGIDEIHIIRPCCVMTNIEQKAIFDMLPTRSIRAVSKRLSMLDTHHIKIVAIDMWRAYRSSVQAVIPRATIVVDKFHVVRLANNCLESVRKDVRKSLSHHYVLQLKDDRFLLLKRRHKLDDFERLKVETWTKNFPLLGEAYEAKERLFDLYNCLTRAEAEKYAKEWEENLSNELRGYFKEVLTALKNWNTEIFNYFDCRGVTNAYTESLNNLIRLVNRNGRGYSFDVIRAKILYSDGVRIAPKPVYNKNYEHDGILFCLAAPTSEEDYGASLSTLIEEFEKDGN